jgi:glycosyltransferase involved in cell wall biosynthesis
MHILFLTDNFPPEVNAPASRTFEHVSEWAKLGHQVTIITCAPNFPKGKVFDGYKNRLWQSEIIDGILVIRVWSYVARNEGFLRRILDYMSFMVTGFFASMFVRRVDVIIGTSPQFFTVCAAWAVSAVKRRPFVFELRDIWPESIRAVGAIENSRILDFLERVELFLYRRASAIVAVTNAFKQNLVMRGIDHRKIHVITNGVDGNRYFPLEKDAKLVRELKLEGKFVAGYIGTHGMAHALETLVETARVLSLDLRNKDVLILLLGDGACREALMERATGLENILFLDTVPKDEVTRYWSLLDISIIHLKKSSVFNAVIPSKMFECMGMGIPILHGVEGESAEIVNRYKVGLLFEPENENSLAREIQRVKLDRPLYTQLKRNTLEAAQSYDRRQLARRMLSVVEAIKK